MFMCHLQHHFPTHSIFNANLKSMLKLLFFKKIQNKTKERRDTRKKLGRKHKEIKGKKREEKRREEERNLD